MKQEQEFAALLEQGMLSAGVLRLCPRCGQELLLACRALPAPPVPSNSISTLWSHFPLQRCLKWSDPKPGGCGSFAWEQSWSPRVVQWCALSLAQAEGQLVLSSQTGALLCPGRAHERCQLASSRGLKAKLSHLFSLS